MNDKLNAILNKYDLMCIAAEGVNEYDLEAEMIVANADRVECDADVKELIEFVFMDMFGAVVEPSNEMIAEVKAVIM